MQQQQYQQSQVFLVISSMQRSKLFIKKKLKEKLF